jgi:hypothetical protein
MTDGDLDAVLVESGRLPDESRADVRQVVAELRKTRQQLSETIGAFEAVFTWLMEHNGSITFSSEPDSGGQRSFCVKCRFGCCVWNNTKPVDPQMLRAAGLTPQVLNAWRQLHDQVEASNT